MSTPELSWVRAIDLVLAASATPLHYKEITDRIVAQSLRRALGATPAATVNAQITNSIKHRGEASPFVRIAKGTFALRSQPAEAVVTPPKLTPDVIESPDEEPQYDIITTTSRALPLNSSTADVRWRHPILPVLIEL